MENMTVEENKEEEKKEDNTAHEESAYEPTELTPVQEKIEEVKGFQPTSFEMLENHWK